MFIPTNSFSKPELLRLYSHEIPKAVVKIASKQIEILFFGFSFPFAFGRFF